MGSIHASDECCSFLNLKRCFACCACVHSMGVMDIYPFLALSLGNFLISYGSISVARALAHYYFIFIINRLGRTVVYEQCNILDAA